jgi:hypothetical protein
MLDPRIYRTGLIVAAMALVVLAFSLSDQQVALNPTIAPDVFNGQNVYNTIGKIASGDPSRRPGSAGDDSLATQVDAAFKQSQFDANPRIDTFSARTVDGVQTLENVIAVRPGMQSGSIVVVAPRDAVGSPGLASASATATLMELADDLQGETLHRTVVLASTSGTEGTSGAIRLASTLAGPIDGVIVLGDLVNAHVRQPIVIPWSSRREVAPPVLRNTLASSLAAQTSLTGGFTGLGGQFAHLAFPFTLGAQAPFGADGIPAVELSLSGEQGPGGNALVGDQAALTAQITGIGRAVLSTISAVDAGRTLAAPSSYLLLDGKVVPGWAISLFALALLVPVVLTTVDGVARARRRGHVIWRSVTLVVAAALPFVLVVAIVLLAHLLGTVGTAPPGPVAAGAVPLHGGAVAVLVLAGLAMLAACAGVLQFARRMPGRIRERRGRPTEHPTEGAAAALLVVLCAVTFAIWCTNPFAALLLMPAVHLWLWAITPGVRVPLPVRLAILLVGVAPTVLVVVYYANDLGYGPVAAAWEAALLLAGHGVSLLAALEWSIVLGCLVSAVTLALLAVRKSHVESVPVTVRGPVTYAGPGSLGGTKSALRR